VDICESALVMGLPFGQQSFNGGCFLGVKDMPCAD
jgi:hypothetical protein